MILVTCSIVPQKPEQPKLGGKEQILRSTVLQRSAVDELEPGLTVVEQGPFVAQ